jgi:hypothetical protein
MGRTTPPRTDVTSACEFKGKQRFTHREARERATYLNRFRFDGRPVQAYRCPAEGHWHVGHRSPHRPKALPDHRRRKR